MKFGENLWPRKEIFKLRTEIIKNKFQKKKFKDLLFKYSIFNYFNRI